MGFHLYRACNIPTLLAWHCRPLPACSQWREADSPLAAEARMLVVQLCGLSGDIFGPAEPPGGRALLGLTPQVRKHVLLPARGCFRCSSCWHCGCGCRRTLQHHAQLQADSLSLSPACLPAPTLQASPREAHLQCMLRIVLPWISPPSAAIEAAVWSADHCSKGSGDAMLLSACKALLAAAAVHRAAGFEAAGAGLGLEGAGGMGAGGAGGGGVLALISALTTELFKSCPAAGAGLGLDWDGEAAELLLETWVELVADPCRGPLGSSAAAVQAATAVFAAVMEAGLAQAAREAEEDEGALHAVLHVGRAGRLRCIPLCPLRLGACCGDMLSCMLHSLILDCLVAAAATCCDHCCHVCCPCRCRGERGGREHADGGVACQAGCPGALLCTPNAAPAGWQAAGQPGTPPTAVADR